MLFNSGKSHFFPHSSISIKGEHTSPTPCICTSISVSNQLFNDTLPMSGQSWSIPCAYLLVYLLETPDVVSDALMWWLWHCLQIQTFWTIICPFCTGTPLWSTFFRACSRSSPRIVRILGFYTPISPAASFTRC